MNIVGIDLETTGLDPRRIEILELGIIIMQPDLTVLYAQSWPIFDERMQDEEGLNSDFIQMMHGTNGLLGDRRRCGVSLQYAEHEVLQAIETYSAKRSPLFGSTVSYDRAVLHAHDSAILRELSHRHIDVSTLRELAELWGYQVAPKGRGQHRALPDLLDSLDALKHYRRTLFADLRAPQRLVCPNEGGT